MLQRFFQGRRSPQEPDMKKFHNIALVTASAAFLSLGSGIALAQAVSSGDPYQQGYAAGASAKERNGTALMHLTVAIGLAKRP
jgi:hypothetical protein